MSFQSMKYRPLLVVAAFCLFTYGSFAQNPNPQNSPTQAPTGPQSSPTDPSNQKPDISAQPASADNDAAKKNDKPVQLADPEKVKHDGGKEDVDAIGNRNVGCKQGLGNWYSIEKQVAMGRGYAQQVESQSKMIADPVVTEYVNRIGQNIVRNSDAQVPFTIKVIDSDVVNAMALPGGYFYVNSGLILAADEEAELAGVMAHEIAHVAACHAAREQSRGNLMQMASIPLIFIGGPIGYAGYEAAGVALPMTFLKFSRDFEAQADYLGVQYMYKSGYDPSAFITFFEKIEAMDKKKPGSLAKAFDTHPQTPDRIEKTQQEIASILPARPQYIVSTSEFDDVKSRLAAIENRHKVTDKKDANRPSLRRTSTADKTGGDKGDNPDDDRPTLKRRPDQD
ncbi:MAG TPA: M48 family metallopeptidase [Terriglobales bacterium]|jgi:predicted Zn-dependent protease